MWSLIVVWLLALTISVHDGVFTRIPLEYEEGLKKYNYSVFNYERNELRFLPNQSVWKNEKRQVYQLDENLVPITVKACKMMVTETHYNAIQVVYFVIGYLLPSIIMIICYGLILRKLFTRRIMAQLEGVVSQTARRLEAARRRHTIIIILLVAVYICLWGPYLIYKLQLTFKVPESLLDTIEIINVLKFLTYICTIMNPLIYMMSSGIFNACCGKNGKIKNIRKVYHNSRLRISEISSAIRMSVYRVWSEAQEQTISIPD